MSDNFAEIIVMLFAVFCGWGAPFVAIHLLFIHVVADGIPDMFFYREPAETNIMSRKPVDKNGSLFANGLGARMVIIAVVMAILTLVQHVDFCENSLHFIRTLLLALLLVSGVFAVGASAAPVVGETFTLAFDGPNFKLTCTTATPALAGTSSVKLTFAGSDFASWGWTYATPPASIDVTLPIVFVNNVAVIYKDDLLAYRT